MTAWDKVTDEESSLSQRQDLVEAAQVTVKESRLEKTTVYNVGAAEVPLTTEAAKSNDVTQSMLQRR